MLRKNVFSIFLVSGMTDSAFQQFTPDPDSKSMRFFLKLPGLCFFIFFPCQSGGVEYYFEQGCFDLL